MFSYQNRFEEKQLASNYFHAYEAYKLYAPHTALSSLTTIVNHFLVKLSVFSPTKVFLLIKFPFVRAGLRHWLGAVPDFFIVGEAATVNEGLSQIKDQKPDVVLLDINGPEKNYSGLVKKLKSELKISKILLIGNESERFYARDIMKGIDAQYFSMHEDALELLYVMRKLLALESTHLKDTTGRNSIKPHEEFSAREYEIFYSVLRGEKITRAAKRLSMHVATIRKCKIRMFNKINVTNEVGLIRYAVQNDIPALRTNV